MSGPFSIRASHGQLEALLGAPREPALAVLVCHPHPAMGGTMHHPIAYRIAKAFEAAGAATLRFNFRGVGTSSGRYDEGKGELEDAREALAWLRAAYPTLPLCVAGFSFGAWVGLRLASEEGGIERALAAGLPVRLFDFGFLEALRAPLAVIQADADEYGSLTEVKAALSAVRGPTQLFVLETADHVASGRLKAFEALAAEAVSWLRRPA